MKLHVRIIMILGLMFNINSISQAQESTVNPPANADTTTTTTSTPPTGQQIERVEVIGSRIKRIQKEGANPVKNVGKESMKNSANTTASDSLRDSTLATYGVSRETAGNTAAATTTVGLRGFGDTRTLVLLNGHRLPVDPSAEAVDLNWIPQSAIERIEVLKDGASALYGSDALGGVINIVTKKGFTGTEASVKVSGVQKPGGNSYDISMLSGLSRENLDFMVALNYNHTDKILGKDRDLTKDGMSLTGTTPAWQNAGGLWTVQAGCPADLIVPDPSGNGNRCAFRYNEVASIRPQVGMVNLLTDLTYRMDSGMKFYNRNLIVYKDIEWNFAPTPGSFNTPAGTPSEPNARRISYRLGDAGNRDNNDKEINYSALVGLKGSMTSIWEYDASVGYSEVFRKNQGVGGYLNRQTLLNLVATPPPNNFDPLAPAGSRGDISSALVKTFQDQRTKLLTFDGVATGELGEMENGPIGVATGVSLINEKLDLDADEISKANLVVGDAGETAQEGRDIQSVFAEVTFPVTATVEIDAAARVDHYSDFGTAANPKLSVKWTASPAVLVRSSVGTGYKAPTLSQLYSKGFSGFPTFIDRKLCNTNPSASTCTAQQWGDGVEGTGNKDLKEEKAFTASLGTVIQPHADISFSIDAWYTKVTNIIDIDYEALTEAEMNGADLASYGITVQRDVNGAIELITAPQLNLSSEEISGIDLNAELALANNVLDHGLFFENDFSFIMSDKSQGFPGTTTRDVVDEWGKPRWRNVATVSLKNDISTFALSLRSIPGQKLIDRNSPDRVSDLNEWDINASYKFTPGSQLTLGVKNIIDAKQPVDSFGGTGGIAFVNNDLYDVNGRKFFVGYTQKF